MQHVVLYTKNSLQCLSKSGTSLRLYKYRLFQVDCSDSRHAHTRHAHNPCATPECSKVKYRRFARKALPYKQVPLQVEHLEHLLTRRQRLDMQVRTHYAQAEHSRTRHRRCNRRPRTAGDFDSPRTAGFQERTATRTNMSTAARPCMRAAA